jgi:hypothetical protein
MPGNVPPEVDLEFLMTEVGLGLTFARIALDAAPQEREKIARNKGHAQQAWVTILCYYDCLETDPVNRAKLDARLRELMGVLNVLNSI